MPTSEHPLSVGHGNFPGKDSVKNPQKRTLALLAAVLLCIPMVARAEVAVTLPPLAGLVRMLDPSLETFCLLGAGADPHHFQISPRTAERLQRAELLIRSPGADGGWPLPSDDKRTLSIWNDRNHAWLLPSAVARALPEIAERLMRLHPSHEATIRENLADAMNVTQQIDSRWKAALAPLRRSGVVMQHPSWSPLMDAAGVPVLAVLESPLHGHEEGPHRLEEALNVLRSHPGAVLIGDLRHNNRSLEWLARHAGSDHPLVFLDALGECGSDWPSLMRSNLDKLAARLSAQ